MNTTQDQLSVNDLIDQALSLRERIDDLTAELGRVTDLIRTLGEGEHGDHGRRVVVSAPPRRFDLDKAVALAPAAVLTAAMVTSYDPKIIKSLLPPVLTEQCMAPGSGKPRVIFS